MWARRNWNFRIRIINIFISTRIICNAEGDFTYMQENFKHTKYVHATFYIIWTFLWINYLAKTSIYYKNHVLYIDNSDEKSRFYEYEKKMNERERRNHIFREKKWMLRFHISCSFPISNSPNKKSQSAGFSFFLMRTHSEFVVYTYGLKLGEKILQIVINIFKIFDNLFESETSGKIKK